MYVVWWQPRVFRLLVHKIKENLGCLAMKTNNAGQVFDASKLDDRGEATAPQNDNKAFSALARKPSHILLDESEIYPPRLTETARSISSQCVQCFQCRQCGIENNISESTVAIASNINKQAYSISIPGTL